MNPSTFIITGNYIRIDQQITQKTEGLISLSVPVFSRQSYESNSSARSRSAAAKARIPSWVYATDRLR